MNPLPPYFAPDEVKQLVKCNFTDHPGMKLDVKAKEMLNRIKLVTFWLTHIIKPCHNKFKS